MRKIERNMVDAINMPRSVHLANTSVLTDDGLITVKLHGHTIAKRRNGNEWSICLAGWNTRTTRSRLSAIIHNAASTAYAARGSLDVAGPYRYARGLGVSSRNGVIRIHDARGETVIDAVAWHAVQL